jgi:hypothetical protein
MSAAAAHQCCVPAWRRDVGVSALMPPGHLRHARARPGPQGAPPGHPHGVGRGEGVLPPDGEATEARVPPAQPTGLWQVLAHRRHGEPPPV